MIPITIGILQQQAQRSVAYNFLTAFMYAAGLSTTFALLGLAAAWGGQVFGSLLSHPIFIVCLIALLIFLALSMFDFYEIRIPQFMQLSPNMKHAGLLSAFIFGLLSGTIASPCLSPGLALLLTIVATIGNVATGFLLLFFFGMGLSIPLLIIGTFSTSLTVLPRAGAWMIEMKKLFGFLILALCFYYAQNILPIHIVLAAFALYLLLVGIYYIGRALQATGWVKPVGTLFGIALVASSVFMATQSFKAYLYTLKPIAAAINWSTDYESARQQALAQNKPLFIDVWGQACSICNAIDTLIMHDAQVADYLNNQMVPVKIEASASNSSYQQLKQPYSIVGVPTFLLIDPTTNALIAHWASEVYEMKPHEFVMALENALKGS
jgi:thiol:disulfide interchange protein DsbD